VGVEVVLMVGRCGRGGEVVAAGGGAGAEIVGGIGLVGAGGAGAGRGA
jgi:hypothetical protein